MSLQCSRRTELPHSFHVSTFARTHRFMKWITKISLASYILCRDGTKWVVVAYSVLNWSIRLTIPSLNSLEYQRQLLVGIGYSYADRFWAIHGNLIHNQLRSVLNHEMGFKSVVSLQITLSVSHVRTVSSTGKNTPVWKVQTGQGTRQYIAQNGLYVNAATYVNYSVLTVLINSRLNYVSSE